MQKLAAKLAMAAMMSGGARGGTPVTVCLSPGQGLLTTAGAQEMARQMFAKVDVTLQWRGMGRACPASAIIISLTMDTPEELRPRALAYALPFEVAHVRIFLDRIHRQSVDRAGFEPYLLAHVMAHEIAHMLEGTDCHSSSGVMKASWDGSDYTRMMKGGLSFTQEDVVLMKRYHSSDTRDRGHVPLAS